MMQTMNVGSDTGRKMRQKIVMKPAPSMRAAFDELRGNGNVEVAEEHRRERDPIDDVNEDQTGRVGEPEVAQHLRGRAG